MKSETISLSTSRGPTTVVITQPEQEPKAAVVLIHEWWGINDHIHDLTRRYGDEGYLCAAPDLFRGKVAKDAQEASRLMHELAIEDGLETIRQTLAALKNYKALKVGITGYCMGGTFALQAACEISELSAAVPFYGDIPDEATLAKLQVPTLFISGKRDNWINPEKVGELMRIAAKHKLPIESVSYDADHAFFNDTRPEVYDAQAAADSWQRVLTFFGKHLNR